MAKSIESLEEDSSSDGCGRGGPLPTNNQWKVPAFEYNDCQNDRDGYDCFGASGVGGGDRDGEARNELLELEGFGTVRRPSGINIDRYQATGNNVPEGNIEMVQNHKPTPVMFIVHPLNT